MTLVGLNIHYVQDGEAWHEIRPELLVFNAIHLNEMKF